VDVDLRCVQIGVAQPLLELKRTHASFGLIAGERVPEGMATGLLGDAGHVLIFDH